jgi:hypothetical protein
MNEEVEEKDNLATSIGKIVEVLLMESELFDEKFYLSACMNPSTGLMLKFVESLYDVTKAATDEEGNITRDFEDMSREAYTLSGFKLPYETVIKKFVGSDDEIYYDEIRKVRTQGLIVITAQDVSNGERIVEELKNNFVTKDIVNLVNSDRWTILNQFQVENYEVCDHKFKSMIDKCIIDHKEKTIDIYDLKTVWAVEQFYTEYYLYRRAYIQGYLYYRAMLSFTKNKDSEYYNYSVNFPKFIVCDSTNYYNPLIYEMNKQDMIDAYEGFEYNGRKYPGVREIIENLQFALNNNIWNISRENYLNNGVVNIKE